MTGQAIDKEWVEAQIKEYINVFPRYKEFTQTLDSIFHAAAEELAPSSIIQVRTKSIPSFSGKVMRKVGKHSDPVRDFTDLSGARIIVQTRDQIEVICNFIKDHFIVDWENSLDVSELLDPSEFGYRSIHYIVSISPDNGPAEIAGVEIPISALPDEETSMKAEIQVRTMCEHAWSEFAHDTSYKSPFKLPSNVKRELAAVAALLESADSTLQRINATTDRYISNYGSYMTAEEIRDEISIQEVILENSPEEHKVAHKIGSLAISLGDWRKAIDILTRYSDTGYQPILRDLGIAMCKLSKETSQTPDFENGQNYLQRAIDADGTDVDAISSLAGTWKGIDDDKAWKLYKRAFKVDPSDPYVLGNTLEYEISNRQDSSAISMMKPAINSAIERCLEQAEVQTNFPWTFFNLGKFYLLTGKTYKSLAAYVKAMQITTAPFMLETAIASLENLRPAIEPKHEWAINLLRIAKATKFGDADSIKEIERLASKDQKKIKGAVVLIVGSHRRIEEAIVQSYRDILLGAFADYTGNIICGGTNAGMSRAVGDIQEAYPATIHTLGYTPEVLPPGLKLDPRYHDTRMVKGSHFSPMQPLQYWIDILASGIDPSSVKVFGIGGNSLSILEYMLAVALGASVVVLDEFDLGEKLQQDDVLWSSLREVVVFPDDPPTLRAYIGTGLPGLPNEVRDGIAKYLHETYRANPYVQLISSPESMLDWEDISPELRESNRHSADHITQKLNGIGCTLGPSEKDDVPVIAFSSDEIEIMAEMEHARWVAEKLLQGWKYGRQKDFANKTSPLLVPWDDLDDVYKNLDRELVADLPKALARFNLQIKKG